MTDAPSTPTPDLRLAYARIIDPEAFGLLSEAPVPLDRIRAREAALAKADAILALKATPLIGLSQGEGLPIPMVLYCPKCGVQHIDEPDERTPDWTNPPHRSHLCHGCGCIWRPADVATNGVAAIETVGKADNWHGGLSLPGRDAGDAEDAAWRWLESKFFSLEAGHDPNLSDYGADEMVDAFIAGRESLSPPISGAASAGLRLALEESRASLFAAHSGLQVLQIMCGKLDLCSGRDKAGEMLGWLQESIDRTDAALSTVQDGSVREALEGAAVNQNDVMRRELANVGNLVSDLARAMGVDQANADGTWPDLAGRIQKLTEAALSALPQSGDKI